MNNELAERKYQIFKQIDPFPEISPALLNSADIQDYITTIGMVSPFEPKLLNGATLSLRIGGTCIYWNEKKEKVKIDIKKGDEFILKRNSIAYVSILERLRLPRYIIVRFNLRVTNAYRGILLGTGPIIDPGFNGNFFIPLHNLTNNDYIFYGDETLIEMEFTKLNPHPSWSKPVPDYLTEELKPKRIGVDTPWKTSDNSKTEERDIEYYIRGAHNGRSIESSLPSLEDKTKEAISQVKTSSDKVDSSLNRINVGLLFSFGTLLGVIVAIVNIFRSDIKDVKGDLKYSNIKSIQEVILNLKEQHKKDSIRINILEQKIK